MSKYSTSVYRNGVFIRDLAPFELEQAKRDIVYFYDEQTQWATLSGNLNFDHVLTLPYWDYLDLRGEINEDDKHMVRKGSLLLLLAECVEFFENTGTYVLIDREKRAHLTAAVTSMTTLDRDETEIRTLILDLLQGIEKDDLTWNEQWEQQLSKISVTEIYGYFRNKYHSFEGHWEILYRRYRGATE